MYDKTKMTRRSSVTSSVDPISLSLLGDVENATVSVPHSTYHRTDSPPESRLSVQSEPAPVKDVRYWAVKGKMFIRLHHKKFFMFISGYSSLTHQGMRW